MKWFKFIMLLVLLVVGAYAASMYFVDEEKSLTIEKEVNYPLEKVYPQFNDLQKFTQWNQYFLEPQMSIAYYEPYQGQGASLSFINRKKNTKGELYIRYENPFSTLKYQLFENNDSAPYLIDVKLKSDGEKTKVIWFVHTPKQSLMMRSLNFWAESSFAEKIDGSITNLNNLLSNKVDKEQLLTSIKYDSIMTESNPSQLFLGVNVSSRNKGDALIKNIVMTHGKVANFITGDLGKREDEFGFPTLLTEAENYKDKDVSYFYGVSLPKKVEITDNNFNYKRLEPTKTLVIYYKGDYKNGVRAIQQLLQEAKKSEYRYGELQQVFLEEPKENGSVNIKFILPIS